MTSIIKPAPLSGLRQAAFVMECLVRNYDRKEIVRMLDGDDQVCQMWESFLLHNNWLQKTEEGYAMTPKGAGWNKQVTTA